ncbi:MAG: ABC-type antimicrobial peptide transport system, ATPase component [Candidatus Bipolaricaulis sibiricus]|uniref:ABC-type antimicrobial peptide transport system, ATPase component n=1 Tax=Bipolaricaulis sibiricus TaxID=2501609 RepID=A0A410FVU0_BIPS1|nr:MAG: ABC-type antimicrobial peptide transport system, ATPase component [Candidatus Bipolaricaulis sibiricus]
MTPDTLIEVSGLARDYHLGRGTVPALRGVDLRIAEGEFVAIMGPSGSGKSTLLHLLGGLDVPDGGQVAYRGLEISRQSRDALAEFRSRKVGFVFQMFNLIPTLTALGNVELPLAYQGVPRRDRHRRAGEMLDSVGLADRGHHRPTELSGGEQQRVAIARALVTGPEVLLCDEPTGNLDSASGQQIMGLLAELNRERRITVILVTHEPEIAVFAHRRVLMRDGQVVSDTGDGHGGGR